MLVKKLLSRPGEHPVLALYRWCIWLDLYIYVKLPAGWNTVVNPGPTSPPADPDRFWRRHRSALLGADCEIRVPGKGWIPGKLVFDRADGGGAVYAEYDDEWRIEDDIDYEPED